MKMRPKRSLKREIDTFFGGTRSNEDRKGMMATKLAKMWPNVLWKGRQSDPKPSQYKGFEIGW